MPTKKQHTGFTLIETIIYIGILAIIISTSLLTVYSILITAGKFRLDQNLSATQKFMIQKMSWVLQSVSAVNIPDANTSAATLSVNKYNFNQNPLVVDAVNGILRLKVGANAPVNISASGTRMTNVVFEHIATSTHIEIRMTAEANDSVGTSTIDYTFFVK